MMAHHHDHRHSGPLAGPHDGHHHGGHGHPDHGHAHDHRAGASERRLAFAAILTGLFMVIEAAGGLITGSLALIADAGHMLSDFAALALAWFALRQARRPADWQRTYGFDRFSILVAFSNGLALVAIALWILMEAAHRLSPPPVVMGGAMLAIAAAGLAINLLVFAVLRQGARTNLNMRAAALHVAGDLLGSLAAITAAVVIMATGWTLIDPLLSVFVALVILRSARLIITESGQILLEGAPAGLDTRTIASDLTTHVPGVQDIHHIHLWSITEERPMITLHALIAADVSPDTAIAAIKRRLEARFRIAHSTIEIESSVCADEHCIPGGPATSSAGSRS